MSGGIRTSVKGCTMVKRGDFAVDTTHENTGRDNASETTFINSHSSNAPQLTAAADCIDKKPANEDSPSNPPRDGLNSNVRVSSVSVPSTPQIEGEILQPFNLKSFCIDELKTATRNFRINATVNGVRMRCVFMGNRGYPSITNGYLPIPSEDPLDQVHWAVEILSNGYNYYNF